MNRRPWPLDPHEIARGQLTGLLGLLGLSGGIVIAASVPWGPYDAGSPLGVFVIGAVTATGGAWLLLVRRRAYPASIYALFVVFGSVVISAVLLMAGPAGTGAATILYVFVAWFAFVALSRYAAVLVAVTALMHAGVLWYVDISGGLGRWIITWGVAVVTGVFVGQVVAATRRVLEEQDQLVGQLRTADAAKTTFLHAVGHELARPVTVISGMAETLAARAELDDEQRAELLDRLVRRARALRETLDSLLDLSGISEGAVRVNLDEVELRDVVERAIDIADVDRRRLHLSGVEGRIVADGPKLAHAIANLLTNAAKYAPDGPIDVVGEVLPEIVIVRVEDRGPGVPDRMRWRVFEPFERAEADHVAGGSGLGLSIVRQFAQLHGGDAWVEPRIGGGSRFAVSVAQPGRVGSSEEPS